MSSISKLWRKLRNKAYRDGYTEAQLSIEIPFQIRALRKARGWTQVQLAERCGIPQARISHIEQPGRDPLSLRTLYRLASAFDVGLLVQFVSFSELVRREAELILRLFASSALTMTTLRKLCAQHGLSERLFVYSPRKIVTRKWLRLSANRPLKSQAEQLSGKHRRRPKDRVNYGPSSLTTLYDIAIRYPSAHTCGTKSPSP